MQEKLRGDFFMTLANQLTRSFQEETIITN